MKPLFASTCPCRRLAVIVLLTTFALAARSSLAAPMSQPTMTSESAPLAAPQVLTTTTHSQAPARLPKAAAYAAPLPVEPEVQPAVGQQPVQVSSVEPTVPPPTEPTFTQPPLNNVAPAELEAARRSDAFALPSGLGGPAEWTSPEGLQSALQTLALLTVVSLAPAVLLMTTCFVRMALVLGLLRQSLGTQLPSNQVVTSLAMFMTLLVMAPTWQRVYDDAVLPYTSHEITVEEAWNAGVKPVRLFMSSQIERTGNSADVWLFYKYLPADTPAPNSYDDVPLSVLLPAFMLSELKTAFLIGFQIFLPFLIIDLVVASVTISMGMFMLPPAFVSLPLKLLLFVLVDGWHLVVGMLLDSFQIVT